MFFSSALLFLHLAFPQGVANCDPSTILRVDAVELAGGKETPGSEEIYADHFPHRYLFASNENRKKFLRDPSRYEVQFGGVCARMGPLSGAGSTKLYGVHEGRIYLFASEACRKTFLAAPQNYLETPDPVPETNPERSKRGREILDKAIDAMGGAARLDAIRSYRQSKATESEYKGRMVSEGHDLLLAFPDSVRKEYFWDQSHFVYAVHAGAAWETSPKETAPLHPQQREHLERNYLRRNLISILRSRRQPDAIVTSLGARTLDYAGKKVEVEQVALAWRGATHVLSIDPQNSRILSTGYRAAGPKLALGAVEKVYHEFATIGGVLLPQSAQTYFEGNAVDAKPVSLGKIEIDGEWGSLFEKP